METVIVLAVANQKGGVGKTTTVINLGAYLGALGHKVLLVDCDPQANTSRGATTATSDGPTLYDVLLDGDAMTTSILATETPNVSLVPSSPDLAGAEVELLETTDRERTLKSALDSISGDFRYILLDCPPSLSLLTVNALVAADAVIVPVQCEYLALEGVSRLMDTISRIREGLNPRLKVFGLLMTMHDRRTALSDEVTNEVKKHYPQLIFETLIPRNVRLSEAPSHGQPILSYDSASPGAEAYASLAREVTKRG